MRSIAPQIKQRLRRLETEYVRLIRVACCGNEGISPAGRILWISERGRQKALKKSWKIAGKIRKLAGVAS